LNGLYLKRQRASLRCAILSAIEARFARPLGISEVAVANRHAGEGLMPERYVSRKRSLTRVRALRARGGQLEWEVYDDISRFVNRPISVELEFATLN
jgi:hypothetical protein